MLDDLPYTIQKQLEVALTLILAFQKHYYDESK